MTKTEIEDVRRHLTAIIEAGRRELTEAPGNAFAVEAVSHADAVLTKLRSGGWHNAASAANGKKGGRPRKKPAVN